jgi:hypothetical protein
MDWDRRILRLNNNGTSGWKNSFLTAYPMVHGNVVIEKGDLLFLDRTNGLRTRGASMADNFVYPFSLVSGVTLSLVSNRSLAQQHFLGVAAHWSNAGVTEALAVHYEGLFKYPLKMARSVKTGQYIIPAGSGVTLYNQYVSISGSTGDAIGICGRYEEYAADVEMVLMNKIFGAIDRLS